MSGSRPPKPQFTGPKSTGPKSTGPKYFKTSGHILLCQSGNCTARGADVLYKALWGYLEREGLMYYKQGGSVRLTSSGCLGACKYGPTMCVYRLPTDTIAAQEAWYAAVDFPLASEVAQAVQGGLSLPVAHRYDPQPS